MLSVLLVALALAVRGPHIRSPLEVYNPGGHDKEPVRMTVEGSRLLTSTTA